MKWCARLHRRSWLTLALLGLAMAFSLLLSPERHRLWAQAQGPDERSAAAKALLQRLGPFEAPSGAGERQLLHREGLFPKPQPAPAYPLAKRFPRSPVPILP